MALDDVPDLEATMVHLSLQGLHLMCENGAWVVRDGHSTTRPARTWIEAVERAGAFPLYRDARS